MNKSGSKDSTNNSLSSFNGVSRISTLGGSSLMNGNGQLVYRRSPVPQQSAQQQPLSFDTIGSPSTVSFTSEDISENINSFDDDSINDWSQKYDQLQRQVEALTESQSTQEERYKRSRQENDVLLTRIHGLEDQIRELELNSEHRAKEDERRFKETMAKQTKIHTQECEQHLHVNFQLQQDLFKLKNDLIKSEALIKTQRCEIEKLESELQEKNIELTSLDEEIHKLKSMVKVLKDEESVKSNIISILNEELEENHNRSQGDHPVNDHHLGASSNTNFNQSPRQISSSSRRSSVTSGFEEFTHSNSNITIKTIKDVDRLEASLEKLRDENNRLKETNEELQAQLLNAQLEEGRSLVQEGNKSYSLADELGEIDVQRLMHALKEERDDNARLRKYIDEILLRVVEKNPEILEKSISGDKSCQNLNITM